MDVVVKLDKRVARVCSNFLIVGLIFAEAPKPSKEQLDKELTAYMFKDSKFATETLDSELDEYMASRNQAASTN